MTIKYKPALTSQLSQIVSVDILNFDYPYDEEVILDWIKLKQLFVAMDNNKVIGYIAYQEYEKYLRVMSLAVNNSYRRQGIGSNLVKFIVDLGFTTKAGVRESNLAAQKFFRQLGFTCFDIVKNEYDESPEDCYMFTLYAGVLV